MRFLITGAGQIGTQLARDLLADGHDVTVLRRGTDVEPGARLVRGDAGDPATLRTALTGEDGASADAILHCIHSSYDASAWRRDLPQRERAVMDAAADADIPVVFPESVYAFGEGAADLHEGAPLTPASPLGEVRAQLLRARAAHRATTLSVVAADLLGPTAVPETSVFLQLVLQPAAKGKRAWVLGDPSVPRTLTSIPDMTSAMAFAAQHADALAPHGDAILMAPSPEPLSQRELAERTAALVGQRPHGATGIPAPLLRAIGLFSPTFKELGHQQYLWRRRAVIHPGTLTRDFGLQPSDLDRIVLESLQR
jgi:nucleoside-diphosphate-sugar epimerase